MADLRLSDFLVAAAKRTFRFGEADCLLWMAPWVEARRGIDPAAELAGTYHSALGARRIVTRAGGMVALLDGLFAPLGIERTSSPVSGDVAVVLAPEGEAGAIVLTPLTVCFAGHGLYMRPLPILAVWRI